VFRLSDQLQTDGTLQETRLARFKSNEARKRV
jgi:hypothetical protein